MFLNVTASVFLLLVLVGVTIPTSVRRTQYETNRLRRQTSCGRLEYRCANRECIPSYNVCDGTKDCSDGSDETRASCKASAIKCPSLAFECSYGACIDRVLRCNGQSDCADGSDEEGCPSSTKPTQHGPSNSCGSLKFQCSNGQCINRYDTCDGTKNCDDGSDETKDLCSDLVCPSSSFQCDYGACLESSVKCNDIADCPDSSDEFGCPTKPTITDRPDTPVDIPSETPQGSCRLPAHPQHGAYTSSSCNSNDQRPACRNTPGAFVPSYWLLKYTCNSDYSLNKDSEYSICENGVWKNPVECIKLCPPLKSVSVNTKCFFGGKEVACDRPMKPDTTATAECKQHYKPPSHNIEYSKLLCLRNGDWSFPLFQCIPDCGVQFGALSTLILDGKPTRQGEFPWLAGLYYLNGSQLWEQKCGGTLITPHIVLSAAHCLVNNDNTAIHPSDLRVGLGKYKRDFYIKETSSYISEVREVVIPTAYSGAASFFALDIGLLDLVVSVQVTAFIMPACVDWKTTFRPAPNAEGVVAGWGKTENGKASESLLSAKLQFIGYDQCLKDIRAAFKGYLTHDKFCAGKIDGSQVDHGDSGGGLTFVNPNGQHFLIGVVSTKIPEETSFTLFTDITNREHNAWLEAEKNRLRGSHQES